jgi:hypothetical protein
MTMCYRGGIARFDISASWKREDEPSSHASFFADHLDSGILRFHVRAFSANGKQTGDPMVESLIAKSGYKMLHPALASKQDVKSAEEDAETHPIHHGEIAIPVLGFSARLAIFSDMILASQATDKQVRQEVELLGRCIQRGEFSRH